MRMAQAAAQAAAEIRALTGWLLAEGCPAVALWGLSMGGWLAGMTVCREARLAAVVMTLPTVRSNPSYADRIIWRFGKGDVWDRRLDFTFHGGGQVAYIGPVFDHRHLRITL